MSLGVSAHGFELAAGGAGALRYRDIGASLAALLEHFRPSPVRVLAANQRCWCGSGRKYKVCHLHREQLPLDQRAAWLYQKAGVTLLVEGQFGASG